ncbi:MAG: FAD-dependent thymidylate synthase [Acidobacteriota bacterium]
MTDQHFEKLRRVSVPAFDRILGKPFKILDDGFIRVIDYLGCDQSIVQAARVSYGKGTKKISQDRELIRYLMRHRHTTPFEMCEIKFHLRVPMDTWRQWIRHRTANVNEYSTRYSEAIASAHRTKPWEWRLQSRNNKQGSEGFIDEEIGKHLTEGEDELHRTATRIYEERLKVGVAREQARKDLPLSTYTEAYWKIDLHNLLHFLELRMDATAQIEIRTYANIMGYEIVRKWCPLTWEAFEDYVLKGMRLSTHEQAIISAIANDKKKEAKQLALSHSYLMEKDGALKATLEGRELEEKLEKMSLPIPW